MQSLENRVCVAVAVLPLDCFDTTSFDIEVFDTPVIAAINDLQNCDNGADGDLTNEQMDTDLSQLNSVVLGTQDTTLFSVSYHLSSEDATTGTNGLPLTYYNTTASEQTLFVRIQNDTNTDCFATQDFKLIVNTTPTANTDAATKAYVDTVVTTAPVALTLDITGLTSPNPAGVGSGPITSVKNILESISPASSAREGTVAKIHCTSYAGATVTGINISVSTSPNTSGVLTKSTIAVDSAGTQNESVIQDVVASNTATGSVVLTPSRYTMTFTVTGSTWTHNSTNVYP